MEDASTIEVSWPIAMEIRAEALRQDMSEEEVARRAWGGVRLQPPRPAHLGLYQAALAATAVWGQGTPAHAF